MNLVERYREATTPPPGVEVAPRRERWKRFVWMNLSIVISFAVVLGPLVAVMASGPTVPARIAAMATAVALALAFVLDVFVVFPWGFDRFELVAPWQFRLHEAEEDSA